MKMSLNKVHFEGSALYIIHDTEKFKAANYWMKNVLELFWDHPAIRRLFLVRKDKKGKELYKTCILDKLEYRQKSEIFIEKINGK